MSASDIAWLGAEFTVIGALIAGLAALLAARLTWQHLHRNEAAAVFRAEFVDTTFRLRGGSMDVYSIITPSVLRSQECALFRYEPFLKPRERIKLREAWERYRAGPHTSAPGSFDKRSSDIDRAQSHLQQLLQFAQPK